MRVLAACVVIAVTFTFFAEMEAETLGEMDSLQVKVPEILNNRVARQSYLNDYYDYSVGYPYHNYRYPNGYGYNGYRRNNHGYGIYGSYGQNRGGGWNGGAAYVAQRLLNTCYDVSFQALTWEISIRKFTITSMQKEPKKPYTYSPGISYCHSSAKNHVLYL
uniref:Uncharacterized protein n=1 Tax=Glossina palpalis gambiensis TaxID=67801 RepID=A0A1B0AM85_9MUSC